jgi:hypothetical protein
MEQLACWLLQIKYQSIIAKKKIIESIARISQRMIFGAMVVYGLYKFFWRNSMDSLKLSFMKKNDIQESARVLSVAKGVTDRQIRERWINLLYKSATGTSKTRNLLTPVGLFIFGVFSALFLHFRKDLGVYIGIQLRFV